MLTFCRGKKKSAGVWLHMRTFSKHAQMSKSYDVRAATVSMPKYQKYVCTSRMQLSKVKCQMSRIRNIKYEILQKTHWGADSPNTNKK